MSSIATPRSCTDPRESPVARETLSPLNDPSLYQVLIYYLEYDFQLPMFRRKLANGGLHLDWLGFLNKMVEGKGQKLEGVPFLLQKEMKPFPFPYSRFPKEGV